MKRLVEFLEEKRWTRSELIIVFMGLLVVSLGHGWAGLFLVLFSGTVSRAIVGLLNKLAQ